MNNSLILICGIPNSGKTTFSELFKNVIHLDCTYFKLYEIIERNDNNLIIEGCFETKLSRKKLLSKIKSNKICIYLKTDLWVCLDRELNYRKRGSKLVMHYYEKFEEPELEEGWDIIITIKNNKYLESIIIK